jgi:hypothetical protein
MESRHDGKPADLRASASTLARLVTICFRFTTRFISATAPSISLRKGGGAIRGIGDKFAANPVTGTGSMTVPIATSPGRSYGYLIQAHLVGDALRRARVDSKGQYREAITWVSFARGEVSTATESQPG